MRCVACGTEFPEDAVGAFPCPGCGLMVRRLAIDRRLERSYARRLPPLPGAWAWLPGVCLAMFFATLGSAWLWSRGTDVDGYAGWSLVVLLPLCLGALAGYLSRGFVRGASILGLSVVLLAVVALVTRAVGFV